MQALLLATGETDKLYPLDHCIPSPMIPVMNRPIMAYNLELLGRLGFKHILVSIYQNSDSIIKFFGDGQQWGVHLEYVVQGKASGSAGSLHWVKPHLKEPFLVMPGDEVADFELGRAMHLHTTKQAIATVVVQQGFLDHSRAIRVDFNRDIRAIGVGLPAEPVVRDTGIYIFDPCIFDQLSTQLPSDIHQHLLPALLASGYPLQTISLTGYWNSLETIQNYAEAQQVFLSKALEKDEKTEERITYRYPTLTSRQVAPGIWVDQNVRIHPSVKIDPPVNIGRNTWIMRKAEVGPGVVIGSNVVVDQGANIQYSTVLDETYIGKFVFLNERMVIHNQLIDLWSGENIRVVDRFLLSKASAKHVAYRLFRPIEFILAFFLIFLSLPFMMMLGILLGFTTGRIFIMVPSGSTHSKYIKQPARKNRTFHLLNFNTRKMDSRQDWFGRWVESWEGHRLPELFSILRGDVSIIERKLNSS